MVRFLRRTALLLRAPPLRNRKAIGEKCGLPSANAHQNHSRDVPAQSTLDEYPRRATFRGDTRGPVLT